MRRLLPLLLLSFALLSFLTLKAQQPEVRVQFKTNKGSFTIKLYNETPLHRDNFLRVVREGTYEGMLFHRVIRNFMIQAGGALQGDDGTKYEAIAAKYPDLIPAEFRYPTLFHKRGAVAAARVGDELNPEQASDPIQFYITIGQFYLEGELKDFESTREMPPHVREAYKTEGGTPHLDGAYTVFGEVVEGWKTIEKIAKQETNAEDRPVKDVFIRSVIILSDTTK